MNGHTEIPPITINPEASYDMMHGILSGYACRVWLTDGVILTAEWVGDSPISPDVEGTALCVWNTKTDDYDIEVVVPTDNIRKVEIQ